MATIQIDLDEGLVSLLREMNGSVEAAARELIVLELYRRHDISRGRAAELLGMPLLSFIQLSGRLGIPYFDMDAEEWEREMQTLNHLAP